MIDYENLNGIAIYCALKTSIPILLVDIQYIEMFTTRAALQTGRAHFLTLLHGAFNFIED
jgi:hypothetical protein